MRSLWSGSISFGLVNIPVNLFTATNERRLNFDMLRKKDYCPVGYVRVCKSTGEKVTMDEIVKGYEVQKGDYVILDDKDFEDADVKKTNSIEIMDFVDEDEVDIKYFERPYYLTPGKGASKTYALLREALKRSGKVGIARFVLRTQEHLVVVKAEDDALIINVIRYQEEMKSPKDLELPKDEKVSDAEVKMALELINKLSTKFTPEKYHDTYTEELKETIEKKAKHQMVEPKGTEPKPTEVSDLMAQLKASLAQSSHSTAN